MNNEPYTDADRLEDLRDALSATNALIYKVRRQYNHWATDPLPADGYVEYRAPNAWALPILPTYTDADLQKYEAERDEIIRQIELLTRAA